MIHHTGADHVEVHINKASDKVFISLNSCSVITVFPERTLAFFALIELLGGSAGNQLQAFWNDIRAIINDQ